GLTRNETKRALHVSRRRPLRNRFQIGIDRKPVSVTRQVGNKRFPAKDEKQIDQHASIHEQAEEYEYRRIGGRSDEQRFRIPPKDLVRKRAGAVGGERNT